MSKLYPTRSHTGAAQGGMAAALGNLEEDHWEWHMFDTVKGGDYLADQDAVEILAREAIETVYDLEHWGLPFSRTPDGKIAQRRFGGHTRNFGKGPVRRSCYAADRTGHMILQTCYQQCIKNDVHFYNEYHVLDLLIERGRGVRRRGAVPRDGRDPHVPCQGRRCSPPAAGRCLRVSTNALRLTGDGMAVAYRRGIPLEDMEFYQFHPTGIYKMGILLSEAARGEGAILRNKSGERFMERYAPTLLDLAPRDMVSRCIIEEIREGGASTARIMSTSTCAIWEQEVIDKKLPDITEFARTYLGVEPLTRAGSDPADRALCHGRHPHRRRRARGHRSR